MECVIGIVGKDFILVASDTNQAHSIVIMKQDDDKLFKINPRGAMLVTGEPGDKVNFAEYIQRNLQLYKMINGYDLSTNAAANYARRELATSLRSRDPYHVNMLIAGHDDHDGASLYFMDYLSSLVKLPFAIHGYGSYFGLSICDKYYKHDMNETEALNLLNKIIAEIQKRLLVQLPSFHVRVINKEGIRDLPTIYAKYQPDQSVRHESMEL
ncbi:unnamed protein product [Brachionus calyciflorus]|uniref:Proteasome subunit beta n=1 Tax=Brachionus calyciflorus TaxID=104777 RepID=A0A813W7F3_9BILA|nr:unnamed protein product [Brachionus calyciflorus]